jgi:hypothetical protein
MIRIQRKPTSPYDKLRPNNQGAHYVRTYY